MSLSTLWIFNDIPELNGNQSQVNWHQFQTPVDKIEVHENRNSEEHIYEYSKYYMALRIRICGERTTFTKCYSNMD